MACGVAMTCVPLAHKVRVVPRRRQLVGDAGHVARDARVARHRVRLVEDGDGAVGGVDVHREPPGLERRPGRRAYLVGVVPAELDALTEEAVEERRLSLGGALLAGGAVGAKVGPAKVVGESEDHVRLGRRRQRVVGAHFRWLRGRIGSRELSESTTHNPSNRDSIAWYVG